MHYALRRSLTQSLSERIHSQFGSSPAAELTEIQEATDRGRHAVAGLFSLLLSFSQSAAPTLSSVSPLLLSSPSPLKSPSSTCIRHTASPPSLAQTHAGKHLCQSQSLCSTFFFSSRLCAPCSPQYISIFQIIFLKFTFFFYYYFH